MTNLRKLYHQKIVFLEIPFWIHGEVTSVIHISTVCLPCFFPLASSIQNQLLCSVIKFCLTLWPHGLQHARLPVLHYLLEFAQTRVQWCHPTVLPSVAPFTSCPQSFQCLLDIGIRIFSNESTLHIRWPKYTPEVKRSNTNEVKVTQSYPTLCDPMDCSPWNSPGQNTGVSCCPLLQGIVPIQRLNPGVPHCRKILYQLSHKGSPRTRVGSLSLLWWIFLTQELNWGLLHCR